LASSSVMKEKRFITLALGAHFINILCAYLMTVSK
jgi:hypothetical protein